MLSEEFQTFGGLLSARVITDKETGRSRGFGYVDFDNADAAQKAHDAKNGSFLDGREIRVDFATKRPVTESGDNATRANSRAKAFGDTVSPESETLFVGNLAFNITEDDLSAAFNEVAPVSSLRLPTEQ